MVNRVQRGGEPPEFRHNVQEQESMDYPGTKKTQKLVEKKTVSTPTKGKKTGYSRELPPDIRSLAERASSYASKFLGEAA